MHIIPFDTHPGAKPSPIGHPIEGEFAKISALEADLDRIEQGVPAYFATMRESIAPALAAMESNFGLLISWLCDQHFAPGVPKSQQRQIAHLAHFLVEQAHKVCGTNLQHLLVQHGLVETPPDPPPLDPAVEEAWNSFEWEDLEQWQQAKRPAAKKRKKASADNIEIADGQLAKRIYHGLARSLHPDKGEAEEREARTRSMQQLNAAYSQGDMRTMLELMHRHNAEVDWKVQGDALLAQMKKELERQRKELSARLRKAVSQLPDWGLDWVEFMRSAERQEKLLRSEKKVAGEQAEHLRQVVEHLQQDKELARFLSQYSDEDWRLIF